MRGDSLQCLLDLLCGSRQWTADSTASESYTHNGALLVLRELEARGVLKGGPSHAGFWAAQSSVESYWTLIFDLLFPSWDQLSLDFQISCKTNQDSVMPSHWQVLLLSELYTALRVKSCNVEHLSTEQGREF